MGLSGIVGCGAAVALVAGSLGLSWMSRPEPTHCPADHGAQHGAQHGADHSSVHAAGDTQVTIGPTCNRVEMAGPSDSTYVPDLAAASAADRRKAQALVDGVNEFCDSHPVGTLTETWQPGEGSNPGASHHSNPDTDSRGLDPSNPRTALIYQGELAGVMFVGRPLPALGSIPRAHSHDTGSAAAPASASASASEMLHVYCTENLREALTPNRQLGIKSDLRPLRRSIRPAVMPLDKAALREVLDRVRGYVGDEPVNVTLPEGRSDIGPDPVLQIMRTEIRRSLLLLDERELRDLRSLIRSR